MKLSIPVLLVLASIGLAACAPTDPVSFHPKGGVSGGPRIPEPRAIPSASPAPTPPVDEGDPSFEMVSVSPVTLDVAPGDVGTLQVIIERVDGHVGDITIGLLNLPAGVTAEPVVLSGDDVEADVVVTANAAAAILEPVEAFARAEDADGSRSGSFRMRVRGEEGELDFSYGGGDGIAPIAAAFDGAANLAALADGRVVLASSRNHGSGSETQGAIVVTRFAADGTPDVTFGTGGAAEVLLGPTSTARAADLVLLADGSVLVAGTVQRFGGDGNAIGMDVVLVRLDSQGALTSGFGVTYLDLAPNERATAVVADATGAVVAGVVYSPGLDKQVFLARLSLADGSLDPAFGGGTGVVLETAEQGSHDLARAPDGKLVLTVGARTTRFLEDGTRDAAFGTSGDALSSHDGAARAVVVQADGKVLVAASHLGTPIVARFLADGLPDAAFGVGGMHEIANAESVDAIAADSAGRIAGAGRAGGNVAVFRLSADGMPDAAFAGGSIVRHTAGGATGVALLPDERIVISGESTPEDGFVLRVWARP